MKQTQFWVHRQCEHCSQEMLIRRSSKKRFCNRSCSNAWQHAVGKRTIGFDLTRSNYQKWVDRFGKERADELDSQYRSSMSQAIRNADMSHQKEVARQLMIERNKTQKGKTLEDLHGKEKAQKIRQKLSLTSRGEKNPAYGKTYQKGGRSVKGYYKSFFFRSLLEYSFMKHLESIGRSLKDDIDYECFTIPYTVSGRNRTYRIDFFDRVANIAYEVKPSYVLTSDKLSASQRPKWDAASSFFQKLSIDYKIVSEEQFTKISFDDAIKDNDVVWIRETFRYFKKHDHKK